MHAPLAPENRFYSLLPSPLSGHVPPTCSFRIAPGSLRGLFLFAIFALLLIVIVALFVVSMLDWKEKLDCIG